MPLSDAERRRIEKFSEQIAKSVRGPDLAKLARASVVLPEIKAQNFALAADTMERLREHVMAPSEKLQRIAEAMSRPEFTASLPSVKALAEQYATAFPNMHSLAIDAAKFPKIELPDSGLKLSAALAAQVRLPRDFAELLSAHRVLENARTWARAETLVTENLFPNRDRFDALIRDVAAIAVEPDATAAVAAEALDVDVDVVDGFAAVWLVVSEMSPAERRDLRFAVGGLLVAIYMYVAALATDEKLSTAFGKTLIVFVGLYCVYSTFLKGIESYCDDAEDDE